MVIIMDLCNAVINVEFNDHALIGYVNDRFVQLAEEVGVAIGAVR
jgi:hypothetical protein